MATGFSSIFGGGPVLPAFPTYLSLVLTNSVQLSWPSESNTGDGLVLPEILEATATAVGLAIQFSDATEVGLGYSALINNQGANSFQVQDALGNLLCTIASGTVWMLYLVDNSTEQGTWRTFQFGAGVSQANAASLAGAGLIAIGLTLNAEIEINAQVNNYNVSAVNDRAALVEWAGNGAGAITLPTAAAAGSDWFCYVRNSGGGAVTLTPGSGQLNGAANLTFNANDSAIIVCDGANFWTIGFGQALTSTFSYVSINLAGLSGNYNLVAPNLGKTSYKFTGALAGNIQVNVPASQAQYWINNQCTGGTFTVSSTGVGGTTYVLGSGNANILYCDGLNIVPAVSLSAGVPTFPNGSAAAPSIAFTADATTGLYFAGAHTLGFAANGLSVATVNGNGDWVFGTPASGIAVTINGVANNVPLEVVSGNSAAQANADLLVERAGSTINQVLQGPNLELLDSTNNDGLVLQASGGQIELWEKFNNGAWFQALIFDHLGNMIVPNGATFDNTNVTAADEGGTQQLVGWRGVPLNTQNGNYAFALKDRGHAVAMTAGTGRVYTVPAGVFSPGDTITIINFSSAGATLSITPAGGVAIWWANGTQTNAARTLTAVGVATLVCMANNVFTLSGSALS